ncbi:MAG: PLP-dependent transferase, partial [Bacillota bacterium]|nr:PLP-dependent transferase [Bacillota bacterium]
MKFGTKLIHNKSKMDKNTGALSIPIYQVSTYHQEDVDKPQEYDYSRSGNPTRKALEETFALLEGGERGFAFSSGMAATSSVLATFSANDHIIICEDVYGGTYRISTSFFNRFNVEFTFVNAGDLSSVKANIKSNTKAIFLETPSNPLLKVTDLKGAIK